MQEETAMTLISLREHPEYAPQAIAYFQKRWATENSRRVYEDCITHALDTKSSLPHWYLLLEGETIIGCAGLIPNDFISRMDLWPWLCALYIEEDYRGKNLASLLLEKAKTDARVAGFDTLYLCTDHVGYYERFGFHYLAEGYHPWGETSRIYACPL